MVCSEDCCPVQLNTDDTAKLYRYRSDIGAFLKVYEDYLKKYITRHYLDNAFWVDARQQKGLSLLFNHVRPDLAISPYKSCCHKIPFTQTVPLKMILVIGENDILSYKTRCTLLFTSYSKPLVLQLNILFIFFSLSECT